MGNDIYDNKPLNISFPYTADNATLVWGGKVANTTSIQINYARGVRKQHAIGTQNAIMNPTRPSGSLNLSHLMIDGAFNFNDPGWKNCDLAVIEIFVNGGNCGALNSQKQSIHLRCSGCSVTSWGLVMEGEGLTIVDQVGLEFMQLEQL